MTTTDSVEHTRRLAEAALAAMSRLDIAPTPNNFLIWYNDCSGGCLELSRRLRHLESGGEVFTEELLAELYEAFFGTGREVVRLLNETCARIETAMAHLRSQVAGMTRDAGSYGAKLASFGEALRGARFSRRLGGCRARRSSWRCSSRSRQRGSRTCARN
jgi:hypothetical protein